MIAAMDKRAVKTLFNTYWSAAGWRQDRLHPGAEDFAHAKARGVMFDPLSITHDQLIAGVRSAANGLDARHVADRFLASLSTRRLDWRSALGSYAVARVLPDHAPQWEGRRCLVCGLHDHLPGGAHDLNVMNFMRLKWGGVAHTNPVYEVVDLTLFASDPPTPPRAADVALFRELIASISAVPATTTSPQLHKYFPPSLKANREERNQLIGILGLCGVLSTPAHPGFYDRFVLPRDRILPDLRYVDMAYPACWWRGADGINRQRLEELFGHVL